MLPRRASLVALLSCSVFQADFRFSSAGYVSPVLAASCICCICCFVPCLLGCIAPLRRPGCCSFVLFLPRLPVLLPRCVFPIASPRRVRSAVVAVFPSSYVAPCALASNLRSCPPSFASGSGSYPLDLHSINALLRLGGTPRKLRRRMKYC